MVVLVEESSKFDSMQAEIENIPFEQLVQLVKQLPAEQWTELKQEVEHQMSEQKEREAFRELLLGGPTFSKKQLEVIDKTRKDINKWRAK